MDIVELLSILIINKKNHDHPSEVDVTTRLHETDRPNLEVLQIKCSENREDEAARAGCYVRP
jgi:hypothetical protein